MAPIFAKHPMGGLSAIFLVKGKLFPCPKAVADARLGQQELWLIRVDLQLLAQLADVHPQVFHVVGIRETPDLGQDGLMGQHAVGMGSQVSQQFELGGGQLQLFPAAGDDVARQVDRASGRP